MKNGVACQSIPEFQVMSHETEWKLTSNVNHFLSIPEFQVMFHEIEWKRENNDKCNTPNGRGWPYNVKKIRTWHYDVEVLKLNYQKIRLFIYRLRQKDFDRIFSRQFQN